jgi:hypothetical protein
VPASHRCGELHLSFSLLIVSTYLAFFLSSPFLFYPSYFRLSSTFPSTHTTSLFRSNQSLISASTTNSSHKTVHASQYVTDAGSHSDLLNLTKTAKEQAGKKNEGETQESFHGVQGIHLSLQSYMRKSLTT